MRVFIFDIIVLSVLCLSCNDIAEKLYLYRPDKSECITLIDKGDKRYIVPQKVPSTNVESKAILDVSEVLWEYDEVYVRWNSPEGWHMVVPRAKILYSNLDSTLYRIETRLPKNDMGHPTIQHFRNDSSLIYNYFYDRHLKDSNGLIKRR
jgi:hypothetical protein